MDKKLLFPNSLSPNYKLTRAASFSELSTTKKIVFEQQCQTEACGNLYKQYSCEQLFDNRANLSHLKISRTLKSDNEEHVDTFKATIPTYGSLLSSPCSQKQLSTSNKYVAVKGMDSGNPRPIIAPATLIIDKNKSIQPNTNNQNIFKNYEQPNNEKVNESIFQFKKPSLIIKKPNILTNDSKTQDMLKTQDEHTNDNNVVNNHNLSEQAKRNIFDSKSKKNVDTSELKTKLRSLVAKTPKEKNETNSCWFFLFIILLPLTMIYMAFLLNKAELSSEFCKPHFKIDNIPEELKNNIYGQDAAIDNLIKYFKDRENQTGFDVVAFIGKTGVGKSYTAEIIKKNLIDIYNVLDLFPPFHEKENQAYTSLSVCQCNLIRLENIKTDYIEDAIQFIDKLNSRVSNYCILILALFNTQETDYNLKKTLDVDKSLTMINAKFEGIGFKPALMSFTEMSNESLIKCIKDAADYSNVELSNDDIEYVKNDLLKAESGCKGAYSKVQLVGKLKT